MRRVVVEQNQESFDNADTRTIIDALWSSWPIVATLSAADVGMHVSVDREVAFIRTFQDLNDAGLICYEAFVVGPAGPQAIDAALTARGRALLTARIVDAPPALRQMAG